MSTETQERATTLAKLVATTGFAAVRAVARNEARGNPERFKEYVALGSATLAEIAPDFDETAASFTTYVHAYVRWAIRDQQRSATRNQRALRAVQIALRHFGATTEEPFNSLSDADARTRAQLERYVRGAVSESVLAIRLSRGPAVVSTRGVRAERHTQRRWETVRSSFFEGAWASPCPGGLPCKRVSSSSCS